MIKLPDLKEERKIAANILKECLCGRLIVREALKKWPNINDDPTLVCARHALIHFAADEELHKADPSYKDQQIEWIENLINILSDGNPLPKNIIETYEEYYVMPVSFKSKIIQIIYIISGFLKDFFNKL